MKRLLVILFLSGISTSVLLGQNLGSIGKEKPLRISGGISANQIFYTASGIDSRRDPYSYFLSGNLNFDLYGWSVPLSFSFSNQHLSFQQPFNQYGLHPTYKWVTGHIGYVSMNFSPYTLSGHLFKGVGVDMAPVIKDYPLALDTTGDLAVENYEEALQQVRRWFKAHPDYEIISDTY